MSDPWNQRNGAPGLLSRRLPSHSLARHRRVAAYYSYILRTYVTSDIVVLRTYGVVSRQSKTGNRAHKLNSRAGSAYACNGPDATTIHYSPLGTRCSVALLQTSRSKTKTCRRHECHSALHMFLVLPALTRAAKGLHISGVDHCGQERNSWLLALFSLSSSSTYFPLFPQFSTANLNSAICSKWAFQQVLQVI